MQQRNAETGRNEPSAEPLVEVVWQTLPTLLGE
jgi:hypothetical protein